MKRTIIKIDENLCNGCGNCVTGCHEGALQLINGKAVMVSELFCDGLGACIGECPVGAITLEEREAEPYDEIAVMERIAPKGENVILAHLNHLNEHGETELLRQGLDYLEKKGINVNFRQNEKEKSSHNGCPGLREMSFGTKTEQATANTPVFSQLNQWPIQLHLLNPNASFLKNKNLVLAADCTAFAFGDFHNKFMKNNCIAIACPKLDNSAEIYIEKLTAMIDNSLIDTLSVIIMEVPCCGGLLLMAKKAQANAKRIIPVKKTVIGIQGNIISEEWI